MYFFLNCSVSIPGSKFLSAFDDSSDDVKWQTRKKEIFAAMFADICFP